MHIKRVLTLFRISFLLCTMKDLPEINAITLSIYFNQKTFHICIFINASSTQGLQKEQSAPKYECKENNFFYANAFKTLCRIQICIFYTLFQF